jgi:hypothetical protein
MNRNNDPEKYYYVIYKVLKSGVFWISNNEWTVDEFINLKDGIEDFKRKVKTGILVPLI